MKKFFSVVISTQSSRISVALLHHGLGNQHFAAPKATPG
jgi:hypothetical protein